MQQLAEYQARHFVENDCMDLGHDFRDGQFCSRCGDRHWCEHVWVKAYKPGVSEDFVGIPRYCKVKDGRKCVICGLHQRLEGSWLAGDRQWVPVATAPGAAGDERGR